MAEVYARVRSGAGAGRELQQAMGLHADVQERLHTEAELGAYRAEANLLRHRVSGDSRIVIEHGKIDWYVVLDDERGLKAALSIEYGRKATKISADPGEVDGSIMNDAGMSGLFILTDAMKLSRGTGIGDIENGANFDE